MARDSGERNVFAFNSEIFLVSAIINYGKNITSGPKIFVLLVSIVLC